MKINKSMRIGIDARFFGPESKGLGIYTKKLIEFLEKIDKENKYIIFLTKDNYNLYIPKNKNFRKIIANYKWYSWKEQLFMPFKIKKEKCDFVHFPHFNVPLLYRDKFIVTIHDLILLKFPTYENSTRSKFMYKIKFFMYKQVISNALNKSTKIISVSEFTKKDILRHYWNISPEKISITYEAGHESCITTVSEKKQKEVLRKNQINCPYMLYVGNAYPHKNLNKLVEAFQIWQKKYSQSQAMKLVLVGRNDYFYRKLRKFIYEKKIDNVKILHTVQDDFLKILYRKAHLFVFPSLYEGFGLPPLEACSYGTPVISSNESCMPEILGNAVKYTNVKDIDEFAKNLSIVVSDIELRKKLSERGPKKVREYSWKKTANETYKIYKNML